MAYSDKNILITPNTSSSTADPVITFTGGSASTTGAISLRVYPINSGTISFEGTAGQLFSITNDLGTLSTTLFSVNDVSGIPSIEVLADGTVKLAQYSGNVLIGYSTDPGYKLSVNGIMYGTATSARYADLAEKYVADAQYEPGTVVSFGGAAEVTLSVLDMDLSLIHI